VYLNIFVWSLMIMINIFRGGDVEISVKTKF